MRKIAVLKHAYVKIKFLKLENQKMDDKDVEFKRSITNQVVHVTNDSPLDSSTELKSFNVIMM